MTFRRSRPESAGAPAPDPEARRAQVALEHLRRTGLAPGLEAGPGTPVGREWRALRRRRRVRTLRRATAWVVSLALLSGTAVGALIGGRSAFAWLRGHTDLFRSKSVAVAGVNRLAAEEVLAAAGLRVGQDLLSLDPDSVARAIEVLPRVRRAVVDRSWTRAVRVAVEERKPAALLVLRDTWEIDADGVILPPDRTGRLADLPLIVGLSPDSALAGSRPAAPGLGAGLELASRLGRAGLVDAVSEIDIANPDSLVMILQHDGVPVRVGDGRIPERRLLALQGVLNDLARNEIEADYIDLRFAGMAAVMPTPDVTEPGASPSGRMAGTPPVAKAPKSAVMTRPPAAKKPAVKAPAAAKSVRKAPAKNGQGRGVKPPPPSDKRRPHGKRA